LIEHILFILEVGAKYSTYNFDIKLRQIILCNLISCPQKVLEIIRTMDIKAI